MAHLKEIAMLGNQSCSSYDSTKPIDWKTGHMVGYNCGFNEGYGEGRQDERHAKNGKAAAIAGIIGALIGFFAHSQIG